jgi:glutathione S-transferase
MYTLYYSPGACSLAPHIALLENKLPFELKKVDLKTHMTADGVEFSTVNPKNYVPVLVLENNEILTEAAAILFYIAEHGPDANKIASPDEIKRYRLLESLVFVSSEMHKVIGTFFNKQLPEESKVILRDKIKNRFNYLDAKLKSSEYLTGPEFSVADAYCFTVLRWFGILDTGLMLSDWPNISTYFEKLRTRPAIVVAYEEEGLTR